ncbi:hypothetical protein IEQ34_017331 [Dendrobium chrysotoxum]|uniref:MI domain-containing protein n=1 Tax=Dendrobium chrysotoxum TaxID=161865 RepID=A0AAV7GB38_DENCH|nr:hypothetical protein IEQ34_017331 [Dendrobium chrysotoxum]
MVLAVNEHGAVAPIVKEYFTTGDVELATFDLRDLDLDEHHHYFIKKQISTAVDRHTKEKEMASALPSALYADVISASHISHGFIILLGSAEDLAIDVLDTVEVLALFVARVIVDAPPRAELVERKLGGRTHLTVDEEDFFHSLRLYFANVYDIKHLTKICYNFYGGLNKLTGLLGVKGLGTCHQAGPDSLLTAATFTKLKYCFANGSAQRCAGVLYGLGAD